MYDFFVFGYYATAIGRTFFPTGSEFAQLMLAFMTFGAGFLMRPLGDIFLGTYIDHYGRRAGLMLTLGLMAIGTITIALVPGYAMLGILAPVIVVIGRLIQGFSAGVELGGVSVYLAEIATPGNKGFYVSWQSAYVSIKYSERLAEAGIEPSVGSVGDSYDNALAETVIGLFKTEVIHRRGPWRSFDAVEYATLEWVDWFNNRRLLEPIGNIPPAEAEANYYAALEEPRMAA